MSIDEVRRVADAVLYEGYILYPYRASAQKNRSRWQFGVLMPPGYAAADQSETAVQQAECVIEFRDQPTIDVVLRFLQVQRRRTLETAADGGPAAEDLPPTWDEAVEQEVTVHVTSAALLAAGTVARFTVPGGANVESVPGGRVVRRRAQLAGSVAVRATPLPGPWQAARLTVRVTNESGGPEAGPGGAEAPVSRDAALPYALVAAHMIITVADGAFISMTDPPEWASPAVAACENNGCWPVLAGPAGSRQVMLAAPIILPEHPEVARESPGELYDGTEIDEILTLRTLALSDEEKAAARATDPRAAALIDRVEAMDAAALGQLHGTIRAMSTGRQLAGSPADDRAFAAGGQPVPEQVPWWDPGADASVSPGTDSVLVSGQRVARGSRVRLRPGAKRADAQDMFLAGRAAVVEAVLLDVDDVTYLAVTLADDPAADLQAAHGRFLYFSPDEVEPCPAAPDDPLGRPAANDPTINHPTTNHGARQ
jgi:hypothetical protein